MNDPFYQVVWYLFAAMVTTWLLVVHNFFKFMKNEYPEDYRNLGSPGVVSNNTFGANKKFFAFLLSGKSLLMGEKMRRFVIFMRWWLVLQTVTFMVMLSS